MTSEMPNLEQHVFCLGVFYPSVRARKVVDPGLIPTDVRGVKSHYGYCVAASHDEKELLIAGGDDVEEGHPLVKVRATDREGSAWLIVRTGLGGDTHRK